MAKNINTQVVCIVASVDEKDGLQVVSYTHTAETGDSKYAILDPVLTEIINSNPQSFVEALKKSYFPGI